MGEGIVENNGYRGAGKKSFCPEASGVQSWGVEGEGGRGAGSSTTFPLSLKRSRRDCHQACLTGGLGWPQLASPGNTPKADSPLFTEGSLRERGRESSGGFGEEARQRPHPIPAPRSPGPLQPLPPSVRHAARAPRPREPGGAGL
jgi:hypothetical protein